MSSIKQFWIEGKGKQSSLFMKIEDKGRGSTFTLEINGQSIHYYRASAKLSPPKKTDQMRWYSPSAHITMSELQDLFEALIKAKLDYEVMLEGEEAFRIDNRFKIRANKSKRTVLIEDGSKPTKKLRAKAK